MSKINLVDDIMKNTDDDIIEFLTDEMGKVRMTLVNSVSNNAPELVYTTKADVELVYGVLKALRDRNAEKRV